MAVPEKPLIGLVLAGGAPKVGVEPFFMELVAGMEDAVRPAGASVLLLVVADLEAELAAYRRWSGDGVVDAVVVVNLVHDDRRPSMLASLGLPAVIAGHYAGEPPCTSVVMSDGPAMGAAVELLVSLGHRVIGRVSGPAEFVHTLERTSALSAAASVHGVTALVEQADYSAESGARAVRALLAGGRPTAIIFDNDVIAVAGAEELVRSGLRVPEDVSLLAGDDSALCELAVPPLSAVSIDVHEHGVTVGRAVLSVLRGGAPTVFSGPESRIVRRGSLSSPGRRPRPDS